MGADDIHHLEIAVSHQNIFAFMRRSLDDGPSGVADKAGSPKVNAAGGFLALVSYAIYRCNKQTVGDRVTSLDCLPCR